MKISNGDTKINIEVKENEGKIVGMEIHTEQLILQQPSREAEKRNREINDAFFLI